MLGCKYIVQVNNSDKKPLKRYTRSIYSFLVLLFVWGLFSEYSLAQDNKGKESRYTLDLAGVSLSEAFDSIVELTKINVALDLQLIEGAVSSCTANDLVLEELLACLVEGTNLTITVLPSGTYIVKQIDVVGTQGELTGRVVDVESGEPLISAHVLLAQANTGDVTNSSGRFSFSRLDPGTYKIAVTYIGYQDYVDTVQVVSGENAQIELGMAIQPLISAPIVVSGLVPRFLSNQLVSDTLNVDEVSGTYSGDVLRSVGTVIGVHVGDAFADVHVQGGGAGEHQYRLDGAPLFVPIPQGGLVGPFSPFALDKFTIHKAGYGATHGSSLSGIIEVSHRLTPIVGNQFDLQVDPLSANALAMGSFGDRNRVGVNWMVAARQGLWSFLRPPALSDHLSQWSYPDYFLIRALSPVREPRPDQMRYPEYASRVGPEPLSTKWREVMPTSSFSDDFNFYDVHSALRVHLGSTKSIHASLYKGGNNLGDNEVSWNHPTREGDINQAEDLLTLNSRYSWENTVAQLRFEHIFGKRTFAQWSAWYSGLDFTQDMVPDSFSQPLDLPPEYIDSLPDSVSSGEFQFMTDLGASDRNSVSELGLKSEFNYSLGNRHFFTWGLEGVRSDSDFLLSLQAPRENGPMGPTSIISLSPTHWRWTAFLEDAISFSDQANLSLGVRLTYLDNHETVYPEPRVSFRYDGSESVIGPWAFRAAFGIYRQYVNQFDVASLNINALYSTARFWLPVDESVQPSRSVHVSGAFLVRPAPSFKFRVEGYYKWQPHLLVIDYARAASQDRFHGSVFTQDDLLIGADGFGYGLALSLEKSTPGASASVRYEYSVAEQRISNRFGGNYVGVSWNVPHRVTTSFDVALSQDFTFIGRLENQIGRSWAYRDAYYNFLEPSGIYNSIGLDELSDPESHRLPIITRLDLGFSYTKVLNNSRLQVRLDLTNLLSHSNPEEWVISYNENTQMFTRTERTLTPFFPSMTLRFGW